MTFSNDFRFEVHRTFFAVFRSKRPCSLKTLEWRNLCASFFLIETEVLVRQSFFWNGIAHTPLILNKHNQNYNTCWYVQTQSSSFVISPSEGNGTAEVQGVAKPSYMDSVFGSSSLPKWFRFFVASISSLATQVSWRSPSNAWAMFSDVNEGFTGGNSPMKASSNNAIIFASSAEERYLPVCKAFKISSRHAIRRIGHAHWTWPNKNNQASRPLCILGEREHMQ